MTLAEVIALINSDIVPNGNNEITANVLRPILIEMLQQPNDLIGELDELNTIENDTLVKAINSINNALSDAEGLVILSGQGDPNQQTFPSLSVADLYSELDGLGNPLALWIYDGTRFIRLTDKYISAEILQSLTPTEQLIARTNIVAIDRRLEELSSDLTEEERTKIRQKISATSIDDTQASDDTTYSSNIIDQKLNLKLDVEDLNGLLENPTYDSDTHIFTMDVVGGGTFSIDFPIEALITNVDLDANNNLVITFEDGSVTTIPLNTLLVGVVKSVNGKAPNSQGEVIINTEDITDLPTNYITTNTNQTGLSGNKTTSGTWTFGEVRKSGQNDTQILLAGGGHKPVSDFALADGYLPLTGGTMTGDVDFFPDGNGIRFNSRTALRGSFSTTILSGNTTGASNSILLRPQGNFSTVGQVIIDGNGRINTANHGNSSQWKQAYDATQDLPTNYVTVNSSQNITAPKTFTQSPIVPNGTLDGHTVNLGQLNTVLGDYATEDWVTQQINNIPLPTVNDGELILSTGTGLEGSATFTANQEEGSAFSVSLSPATLSSLSLADSALQDNDLNGYVSDVQYNSSTNTITFYRHQEPNVVVDLPAEQLISGVELDDDNNLVITFADDSVATIPLNTLLVGVVKSVNGKSPNSQGEVVINAEDITGLPSNYITTDTNQTGLSGNKTSSGSYEFVTSGASTPLRILNGEGSLRLGSGSSIGFIPSLMASTTNQRIGMNVVSQGFDNYTEAAFVLSARDALGTGVVVSGNLFRLNNYTTSVFSISYSGLATATNGFSKTGATNNDVLLGSGGHRPVSDFALASAIITPNNGLLTISTSSDLTGGGTFSADQATSSNVEIGLSASTLASLVLADTALQPSDLSEYATEDWVISQGFSTQTLTAGDGIQITGTVISPTYGTAANTIAQGNDSRINNGQTAFGWGNHASAGYLVSADISNKANTDGSNTTGGEWKIEHLRNDEVGSYVERDEFTNSFIGIPSTDALGYTVGVLLMGDGAPLAIAENTNPDWDGYIYRAGTPNSSYPSNQQNGNYLIESKHRFRFYQKTAPDSTSGGDGYLSVQPFNAIEHQYFRVTISGVNLLTIDIKPPIFDEITGFQIERNAIGQKCTVAVSGDLTGVTFTNVSGADFTSEWKKGVFTFYWTEVGWMFGGYSPIEP